MLNFQEKFIITTMYNYNRKGDLNTIISNYQKEVDLKIEDLQSTYSNEPKWIFSIRKAHHLLKDKKLIIGNELGQWLLTIEGEKLAKELIEPFKKINKILFFASTELIRKVPSFHHFSFQPENDEKIINLKSIQFPLIGYLINEKNEVLLTLNITEILLKESFISVISSQVSSFQYNKIEKIDTEFSLKFYMNNISLFTVSGGLEEEILPSTITTTIERRIRDTLMSKKLKEKYSNICQICGLSIHLPQSQFYSEAHHLKPLGNPHLGPDIESNLIVLCPNHHAEFDGKSIAIHPKSFLIEHIDSRNPYIGQPLKVDLHYIDEKYLKYHYNLFRKL